MGEEEEGCDLWGRRRAGIYGGKDEGLRSMGVWDL